MNFQALDLAQKNALLETELEDLREKVANFNATPTPLNPNEREELEIKIERLQEQLQASGDIMARLRAEDGSKDFNKLPENVKVSVINCLKMSRSVQ